jgi:RNA polymerase sigma factor (sigma-70 family)
MSPEMPSEPPSPVNDALGDPTMRRSLVDFVRKRVPASDVEDVVQTVLLDALAAPNPPREPGALKPWLIGVARHEIADWHRRAQREPPADPGDIPEAPPPLEARGLVRWAERQAGEKDEAQKTLAWMAREGEGEKLAAIAADEKLSPTQVRQRVSRMRRWMKERWAAELAAAAMIAALVLAGWWLLRRRAEPPVTHDLPEPLPTIAPEPIAPVDRARSLRADALRACERRAWRACLDGLDQARALDPQGDADPAVSAARAGAEEALRDQAPDVKSSPAPPDVKAAPAPTGVTPSLKSKPKAAPKPKADGSLDDTPSDFGSKSTPGTSKKSAPKK